MKDEKLGSSGKGDGAPGWMNACMRGYYQILTSLMKGGDSQIKAGIVYAAITNGVTNVGDWQMKQSKVKT